MEWDTFVDNLDTSIGQYAPAPHSFFDPKIEALNTFPKQFFDDLSSSIADSEIEEHLGGGGDDDDFSDLIGNDFGDNLLKSEDLSVLSTDEIFSQIDAAAVVSSATAPACASDLAAAHNVAGVRVAGAGHQQSDDVEAVKLEGEFGQPFSFKHEPFCDPGQVAGAPQGGDQDDVKHLIDQSLEKVELDILKLKQEVDINSDEDSLWSDWFSEEDASEISPEYENLLKSLLTTPVDDIDVSLNVFNNPDEYSSEDETSSSDQPDPSSENSRLVEQIQADHCYTLPWGDDPSPGTLTPPNSGDDSEPEEDVYSSPRTDSSSEIPPKFLTTRTVKLKHKKDLKFVFSFKVKEEQDEAMEEEEVKDFSQDIQQTPPASPPSSYSCTQNLSQHKRPMYKGVSVLKRNQLLKSSSSLHRVNNRKEHVLKAAAIAASSSSRNQLTASSIVNALPFKRAYNKLHGGTVSGGDRSTAVTSSREADLAVKSILMPGSAGHEQYNQEMKVQSDRELHNSMERQRRIQLKNELDTLKDKIPDLRGNEKVSKLNVLNVAAGYVKKLEKVETKLRHRKHHLREEKNRLIRQLSQLNQLGYVGQPAAAGGGRLSYSSA